MKITVKFLEKHLACQSQIELFEKVFPRGAEFTLANLNKARKVGLDILWLSDFLSAEGNKKYWESCPEGAASPQHCGWDFKTCVECIAVDLWNLYVDGYMEF